ncbi:MAG: hypothetical protein IJ529_06180 [Alphaproteobacteria bacterium]|nr:hypothetical protein [Alphaproteobacteria bacterium]MBQ8678038.1 hypothetical protein [Alphaproteobacteria bacterium]
MWIVWLIVVCIIVFLYTQIRRKQKLSGLAELFRMQNYPHQAKAPQIDEINIGYIYGMSRSLSSNIAKSKKNFADLATLIYGASKTNQAVLALLEYSTQDDTKKKQFIKAANTAMDDVANLSALLSSYDPLSKGSQTKMPDGLSKLYKEQKKK